MRKLMLCFLCFILIIGGKTAKAAASPSLSVDVKGNVEIGKTIQILVNVGNIESFYAGAASLKYDPKILKVISFEKGDLITKGGTDTFDVGNKIDNVNGVSSFGGFTCMGQTNGFSGSGTFLKINVQILKNANFHIKSQPFLDNPNESYNLKLQLCDKDIKLVNYEFKGYEFKVSSDDKVISNDKDEVTKESESSTDKNSNTKASTNSTVNNDSGSNKVSTATNSDTNNNIGVSTEDSETKNKNTDVATDTNSNEKSSTDSSAKNDDGIIDKIKTVFSENDEKSNETTKNSGRQKGLLIGGTIMLVIAVAGGIFFYRKKHQKINNVKEVD